MKYSKDYRHLNLWNTSAPLVWKGETISIKFKICISQLTAEILLKQQSLKQISHFGKKYSNLTSFFFIKKYRSISMTFKIKSSQFCNENEQKQWKWKNIRHFLRGTYLNLTLFFTDRKILEDFSYFYVLLSTRN